VELVVGRGCTRRREIGIATSEMLLIDEVRFPSGKLADIEGNGWEQFGPTVRLERTACPESRG